MSTETWPLSTWLLIKAGLCFLLKRLDSNIENVSTIMITNCFLHNIFEFSGDESIDDADIPNDILQGEIYNRLLTAYQILLQIRGTN